MIDSLHEVHATNADCFERIGVPADPHTAGHTRDEFARWLQGSFCVDFNRADDLILAMNEALANTAEFAYLSAGSTGTMDVRAAYDPNEYAMLVTVADRGQWRTAASTPGDRSRGRGIALMNALADHASIQTSTNGTTVKLSWTGVHPR